MKEVVELIKYVQSNWKVALTLVLLSLFLIWQQDNPTFSNLLAPWTIVRLFVLGAILFCLISGATFISLLVWRWAGQFNIAAPPTAPITPDLDPRAVQTRRRIGALTAEQAETLCYIRIHRMREFQARTMDPVLSALNNLELVRRHRIVDPQTCLWRVPDAVFDNIPIHDLDPEAAAVLQAEEPPWDRRMPRGRRI